MAGDLVRLRDYVVTQLEIRPPIVAPFNQIMQTRPEMYPPPYETSQGSEREIEGNTLNSIQPNAIDYSNKDVYVDLYVGREHVTQGEGWGKSPPPNGS